MPLFRLEIETFLSVGMKKERSSYQGRYHPSRKHLTKITVSEKMTSKTGHIWKGHRTLQYSTVEQLTSRENEELCYQLGLSRQFYSRALCSIEIITPCTIKTDKHLFSLECFMECWMLCRNKSQTLLQYIMYVLFEDRASLEGQNAYQPCGCACSDFILPQAHSLCQFLCAVPSVPPPGKFSKRYICYVTVMSGITQ